MSVLRAMVEKDTSINHGGKGKQSWSNAMINPKYLLQYLSRKQTVASPGPSMKAGYQHFERESTLQTPYKLTSTPEHR